jgi:tetratricopeptide (TPR) repeat protein
VEKGCAYLNIALLYTDRPTDDTKASYKHAAHYFLRALDEYTLDSYPVQRRDTLRAFGKVYFSKKRWEDAYRCFAKAIEISEDALGGNYTEPGKQAEVAKNRNLYSNSAYCLLKLGRPGEALVALEKGKARMLNEALDWKYLDTSAANQDRRKKMQWARDEIVRLEAENRRLDPSADPQRQARLGRQLGDAYRHLTRLRTVVAEASIDEIDLESILSEIPAGGNLRDGVSLII